MPRNIEDLIEQIGTQNQETLDGIRADISDMQQKMARHGGGGSNGITNSWGSQFINSKTVDLAQVEQTRGRTSMEVVRNALTTDPASGGALGSPFRDTTVTGLPQQRLFIRDLLTVVPVNSGGSAEYAAQTNRTNNAAVAPEGTLKAESSATFELRQVPLVVIATWLKASRQILSDAPQLSALIDTELTYDVGLAEEEEILFGAGGAGNLEGLVPQATAFADPLALATPTEIDTLGSAILQASLTRTAPDGIALNPADWWRLKLTKDDNGRYIFGDPQTEAVPRMFGLPVAATEALAPGNFLVGSFKSQVLYDRWKIRIEAGFEGQDFVKNMVSLLAEERVGLAVKRPEALIYGSFA
ncbi:MAG: phage major capsid protein [Pseudomonadota bacterium]